MTLEQRLTRVLCTVPKHRRLGLDMSYMERLAKYPMFQKQKSTEA